MQTKDSKNVKTSKTILLWSQNDLLSSSVELFLSNQKGWEVISPSFEPNFEALVEIIDKIHPEVVIVQQGDSPSHLGLPAVLLQNYPWLKVITLNVNNNLVEVYCKQNILIKSASDLISVIETYPSVQTSHINGAK